MTPNIIQQSSTYNSEHQTVNFYNKSEADDYEEGDHLQLEAQPLGSQTRESSTSNINSVQDKSGIIRENNDNTSSTSNEDKDCVVCKTSDVPVCHIQRDHLENLKNSTKRLLCLLEEVQEKTHSTALVDDDPPKMSDVLKPLTNWDSDFLKQSVADIIGSAAMKRLEKRANGLDAIIIKDDADDCTVYQRLTRKCHCLNQQEYNDFIIHFNEDTKFCTTTIGEIIKNMRILKKFLYMGGKYTINSLLFLNQGLDEGSLTEKSDIMQACAFADICGIFDTYTIVTVCISWPCKNPKCLDPATQDLAAEFLYNVAKIEEGRRYLNLNSKITCDIKKVLKLKQDKVKYDTVEILNSILSLLQPLHQRYRTKNLTYYSRPVQEDEARSTLNALIAYRQYMTLNEVFLHLEMLNTLSGNERTKADLTTHLPKMLSLFKHLLLEFDNSDMNVTITNILNNIVGQNDKKDKERTGTIIVGEMLTSSTATEPIKKKNAIIQFPVPHMSKHKQKKDHPRHVHHTRRPASTVKLATSAKPLQPSRPKTNLIEEINEISSAIDEVIKRSSEQASRITIQKLIEDPARQQRCCSTAVYRATIHRSQKFIDREYRNVITVPMNN